MAGAAGSLFMLPFDHRESFESGLFGWSDVLSEEQTAEIAASKRLIYAGVLEAIRGGVPRDFAAILVDEQFGAAIIADAHKRGLMTACPVETSGQPEFDFQYGEDFARHIEAMDPTYCKALVRYNPEGDAAMNVRQSARLRRLSEYLRRAGRKFLFELLVPPEPIQLARVRGDAHAYDLSLRPPLVVRAIRELQDAGIEPDIWKIEGLDRRQDCVDVGEVARRAGRDHVSCIVLGHHADEGSVIHWLEVAATVPEFIGFAIGRTTFWNPLQALLARGIDEKEAVAEIARSYRHWVTTWQAARRTEPDIAVFSDDETLMRAAANDVIRLAGEAVATRGRFLLALSGGSTPRRLYELLAQTAYAARTDWSRVHVFWGDERCVPPDDPRSNYRMAREALLDRVPIPATNVHRILGEAEPHRAAEAYEDLLRGCFGLPEGPPVRSFDLVLLGMGTDGHTASLFPGTSPVTEKQRWVMANHVEKPDGLWRITLTPVVLNAAADATFLVTGPKKAEQLRNVLRGNGPDAALPARIIRPTHGALHWRVDAAAASRLQQSAQREGPERTAK